jgi:hypothetical protein
MKSLWDFFGYTHASPPTTTPAPPPTTTTTIPTEKDPLRIFTSQMRAQCWEAAQTHPKRAPERWRIDPLGNILFKPFKNCQGPMCYQHDHVIPHSQGGNTHAQNCQVNTNGEQTYAYYPTQ